MDNGTIQERTSAKLQFHYDLTTADGQHIELNVKAKVRQTSVQDAAGNSISKTQLKLQFSLLQEGVADGVAELPADSIATDAQGSIADELQTFLSTVQDALQQFLDGGNDSADDLIKKTVDTFNTLLGALSNLLLPGRGNGGADPLPGSGEPTDQLPAIDAPAADTSPIGPETPGVPALPPLAAEEAAVVEDSAVTDPVADEVPVPPAEGEVSAPPEADTPAPSGPLPTPAQVLTDVRLRFTQSLTQIIRSLTPQDQTDNAPVGTLQYLHYQSALSLHLQTAGLVDAVAKL